MIDNISHSTLEFLLLAFDFLNDIPLLGLVKLVAALLTRHVFVLVKVSDPVCTALRVAATLESRCLLVQLRSHQRSRLRLLLGLPQVAVRVRFTRAFSLLRQLKLALIHLRRGP